MANVKLQFFYSMEVKAFKSLDLKKQDLYLWTIHQTNYDFTGNDAKFSISTVSYLPLSYD